MKFDKTAAVQSGSGGEKFLKIKAGESVNGIFRGEIHHYFIKWVEGKSVQVSSDEPGAKIRFEANFVTMVDGRFVAKVFGFSQTVYNLLAEVNNEYDLEKTKVKISRRGEKLETEYSILPLLKEPIPPQIMKQIEAVTLNILDAKPQPVKEQKMEWSNEPLPEYPELPF
jgi:hypothetical protein